jgi:hypothetical protein
VTSILGGRFIMMKYSGTMMGQPFEGIQIVGYDNMQGKYLTFWIDNSSTAFFLLSGTYDAAKKTWTDSGRWADPMGERLPSRFIKNNSSLEFLDRGAGCLGKIKLLRGIIKKGLSLPSQPSKELPKL